VWPVFKLALRAAAWRTTPDPPAVGLRSLVVWSVVLAAVRAGLQLLDAGPSPAFNPYGLNAGVAWIAVALAVAVFLVPRACRVTVLSAMVVLAILAEIVMAALNRGALLILSRFALGDDSAPTNISMAILAVHSVWWIGAMLAIFRSVQVEARLRRLGKVVALWLALLAANALVPHAPVFVGPNFDISRANWWEFAHAQYLARRTADGAADPDIGAAETERLQPALLQAAAARLAPRVKGATNIYAIGLAGWADQDVFLKELDGALAAIGRDLPIADRTLRLVNQPGTVATVPLASRRNFAAAVHAVAKVMNKQDDVLILLMTSHGTTGGVALRFPDGGSALLGPRHRRADGGGPEQHLVRLRPGTGMDLFRRRVVQSGPAAGNRFQERVQSCEAADRRLGTHGRRAELQSAGLFRDGAGREAGPGVPIDEPGRSIGSRLACASSRLRLVARCIQLQDAAEVGALLLAQRRRENRAAFYRKITRAPVIFY
jgi:hypothetical protein